MFTEGLDHSALQWVRQVESFREDLDSAFEVEEEEDEYVSTDVTFDGEATAAAAATTSTASSEFENAKISALDQVEEEDQEEESASTEVNFDGGAIHFDGEAVNFDGEAVNFDGGAVNFDGGVNYDGGETAAAATATTTAPTAASSDFESTKISTLDSGHAAWQAIIAYEACIRLCLHAWSRGCAEAPEFLRDECILLRTSFGLQQLLLQPYGESSAKESQYDVDARSGSKAKATVGKVKVQVRKVKLIMRMRSGCQFPSLAETFSNVYSVGRRSSNKLWSGWGAVRKIRVIPRQPLRANSMQGPSNVQNSGYLNTGAQYMRQVSGLLKAGVNTLRSASLLESQDSYFCVLKLRSSPESEAVRVQPGGGEVSIFHPEVTADELLVEVSDCKGSLLGRATAQLSATDEMSERVRWWPIYNEPDHECVGKLQLFISYVTTSSELGPGKWGAVGETVAYDIVLEVAMKVHQFGRRRLRLYGSWQWLLCEFAVYYGVSDIYTKLRYLACVMDVATPTEDCLSLIYELLIPIITARDESELNRQEKRIFADVEEQLSQLLAFVFENYKSLDESSPSGFLDFFQPPSGVAAPSLSPAVQVFTLLNDILSTEAQATLRNYFQTAARKRCKRLMAETDEFVATTNDGFLADPLSLATAYLKMKNLCSCVSAEIATDMEIHNQHVLPSSIDLPNITASIYNVEVCNRLRAFLVACPPSSPSPPVADLLIATANFQRDLSSWGVKSVKGGVDAKDLFHLYIVLWIQEKRLQLLEVCKFDKVRLAGVTTQHGTAPFVEEVYERMKETLSEYDVIISRWPEYTFVLENAVADVERAVLTALEKHYADVLVPLKEVMVPKKFTLQYMQKLARRRSLTLYSVPNQLGVVLNTIKRLLDTLRPKLETQLKAWVACLPVDGASHGKMVFGERLNEVTVALRTKYRSLLQAIVEKLADNARLHPSTKLKRILEDTREAAGESDMRERMQHLNTQLLETISHLHEVFTTRVFVAVSRGYWDRMAKDVLHFLENRKENRSWYKSSCFALGVLDDIFASQMQRLQGNSLHEKDLEPPRSVMEARSMLSKDVRNGLDSSSYLF
ncbi:uncharacterized protein LOC9632175 [Selaginella moellendorffii]|uniref:uncharacterized protein LOC9632175 n=1 Tax=Selaginella moellendorffii TaxID=88036 RepID=UPI000D1CA25F|nr:uncharacterized protein LOC9632175 [Selaginella moellendorffii]|eukprot:XP_024531111.1 uncharacterized protein LOC9632175 [Selaginella moellendorffii]